MFASHFKLHSKKKVLLLCSSLLVAAPLRAIVETIQPIQTINFGMVITRLGSCEMDAVTGAITSAGNICIGSETLGHYRITGDPNELQTITLSQVVDGSQGLVFTPKGRLVNNLGDDILASLADTDYNIRLGSDGILDIYVGGVINFTKIQNNNSSIQINYDIEFVTAP